MPLDPSVNRFLTRLATSSPRSAADLSVAERREGLAALMHMGRVEVPLVSVEERQIAGHAGPTRIRIYSPPGAGMASPGLVYFHGGGLIAGSLDTHDGVARALSAACGCRLISIDYRLAPEHPFPAALHDASNAWRHIKEHAREYGIDSGRLGICGDSAGATLVATTVHDCVSAGNALPALQLLLCPILDHSRQTASKREFARGYLIDQETLDHDLKHYLTAQVVATDARVSPLLAPSLRGVPRTFIHTAQFDPLRDEGQAYGDRLAQEETEVSYTCHPGMIHLFYGLGALIPYAQHAFEQIGRDVRSAFT